MKICEKAIPIAIGTHEYTNQKSGGIALTPYLCLMPGIVLAIVYFLVFVFLIRKLSFFRAEGMPPIAFLLAFLLKVLAGVAFWAVYSYHGHYQDRADAFLYFNDGKAIYQALFERPLDYLKILLGSEDPSLNRYLDQTGNWNMVYTQGPYNESRAIIRFNAVADIFSFGSYHVHTVFMCFLSFMGLMGIYKTFLPFLPDKKRELYVCIFLLPSVLFWGSAVLKEGLMLFASGMLVYHWFRFFSEGAAFKRGIFILAFLYLLALVKLYLLLIFLPALIAYAWIVKTGNRRAGIKCLAVFALYYGTGMALPQLNIPFQLMDRQRQNIYMANGGVHLGIEGTDKFIYIGPEITRPIIPVPGKPGYCKIAPGVPYVSWYFQNYTDSQYVQRSTDTTTYWIYYNLEPSGSLIDIPLVYPTWSSVIRNSPAAFLTTAFRPHPFEAKNPFMLLSAAENILILAFILVCLGFASFKKINWKMVFFCLSLTVPLFILIGLTTPVLGAVVRYKVPVLPFLPIAFLFLPDKEKLLRSVPALRKILG